MYIIFISSSKTTLYASDFENKMGYKHRIVRTKKNKEQADNNRRLAQIYNRICEGYGDSYDEDTIRNVYKYVTNKNKTVIDEIDKKQSQEYMSSSEFPSWESSLR